MATGTERRYALIPRSMKVSVNMKKSAIRPALRRREAILEHDGGVNKWQWGSDAGDVQQEECYDKPGDEIDTQGTCEF